jgi:transcription elongation GreA/GreB family factor
MTNRDDGLVVRIGSRVRIQGDGCDDDEIVIIESPSNMGYFRLSTATPLGRALLGRRVGEVVTVQSDAAAATFTILGVDE